MAKYDELPVYKASYDLLTKIFRFAKDFTKEYKYTVGERLKNETLDLITMINRANSKKEKFETLNYNNSDVNRNNNNKQNGFSIRLVRD